MVKYCKYCGKELKEEYTAANGYTGWGPCDCPTVTELTKLESEQVEIKRQICALELKEKNIREKMYELRKNIIFV